MEYLRNRWYVAGWASELPSDGGMLARTILAEPIVFYRHGEAVAALRDQCPHRFAPLRLGSVTNGVLQCAYHGLAFARQPMLLAGDGGAVRVRRALQALLEEERAVNTAIRSAS